MHEDVVDESVRDVGECGKAVHVKCPEVSLAELPLQRDASVLRNSEPVPEEPPVGGIRVLFGTQSGHEYREGRAEVSQVPVKDVSAALSHEQSHVAGEAFDFDSADIELGDKADTRE